MPSSDRPHALAVLTATSSRAKRAIDAPETAFFGSIVADFTAPSARYQFGRMLAMWGKSALMPMRTTSICAVPAFVMTTALYARIAPAQDPSGMPPDPPPPPVVPSTAGYTTASTPSNTPPPQQQPSVAPSPAPAPVMPAAPAATATSLPQAPTTDKELRPMRRDGPRYDDAHVDRVMLLPTAETHPEGTVYLSSYEIVVLQAGYAASDSVQITLTTVPPVFDGLIVPADVSLKVVLAREPRFRLAAIGSVSGIMGLEEGNFFIGRLGGVAQFCFERRCDSSANMGITAVLAGPATVTATGLGFVWRLASWFSLLFEADTLVPLGPEIGRFNGVALGPGVRFFGKRWGIDLAAMTSIDVEIGDDEEPPPVLPFVAFTYRFLP